MLNLEYDIFQTPVIYDILERDKTPSYDPVPLRIPLPSPGRIPPPGWNDDTLDKKINPDNSNDGVIIIERLFCKISIRNHFCLF